MVAATAQDTRRPGRAVPPDMRSFDSLYFHVFVTSASTHSVGTSPVPARSAFNSVGGVVQERLDFRDQWLFRNRRIVAWKDSRVLRKMGGEESAGKVRRPSRRLRGRKPPPSTELSQLQVTDASDPFSPVRHSFNWKVISKPLFLFFRVS